MKLFRSTLVALAALSGAHAQEVKKAWLGVAVEQSDPALAYQLDRADAGVVARRVSPGSPAETAGLHEHDLILSFNDIPIARPQDLTRLVQACAPGQKVNLRVLRKMKTVQLSATLGECEGPECDQQMIVIPKAPGGSALAFRLDKNGQPIPIEEESVRDMMRGIIWKMERLAPKDDKDLREGLEALRKMLEGSAQ